MQSTLTAVEIPCCLCGTLIAPNAANQCATCLAQGCDLAARLQRGPAGAHTIDVHQCRQCRRYAQTPTHYLPADPESPELLALCLKQIPALQTTSTNTAAGKLHLVDAGFIWTEPHSRRFKVRLTVRTTYHDVPLQQRVAVELHVRWQQCPACNREFTNRTWMAVVQLRQKTDDCKRGLAAWEAALRSAPAIRQHVLHIDAARYGFDFYFLTLQHAQAFAQFLSKLQPLRLKTTQKLVSTDIRNATAHVKHTLTADVVPLLRDDLVLIGKAAKHTHAAGKLAIVDRIGSVVKLIDAAPAARTTNNVKDVAYNYNNNYYLELSAETYYKSEKEFRVLLRTPRLTPFVVLDVELWDDQHNNNDNNNRIYQGPASGVAKYAWADVVVARASDFGSNDTVIHCVTHLGHLIQAGDTVLGYDLETTVGGDWELEDCLPASYVVPEVVLVKKVKDTEADKRSKEDADGTAAATGKRVSKKKQRRRKKEGKKMRELEASAVRMGFFAEDDDENENNHQEQTENNIDTRLADFDEHLQQDPELAQELEQLEATFASLDTNKDKQQAEDDAAQDS